jgi:hypothetical protein
MFRAAPALALLLAVCVLPGQSQTPAKPTPEPKTVSAAGLRLAAVPEALYSHLDLPNFQRGHGVLVERVGAASPGDRAGLKRHDILLSYDGTTLRDGAQFARLLQDATADKTVPLVLIRGGKEMSMSVCLAGVGDTTATLPLIPKGLLKPGGPPAVSVEAEALDGGKLRVTFTFYSDGKGKLDRLTCSGSLTEIQRQVRSLGENREIPPRVEDLLDVALKRIQDLSEK